MLITSLIPLQNKIRDHKKVDYFYELLMGGAILNEPGKKLIEIAIIDGKTYIHDGHHRCIAAYMAGRQALTPSEYTIKHWRKSDYNTVSFVNRYYTPFDIETHCRAADFFWFKDSVTEMIVAGVPQEKIERYCFESAHLFSEKRKHINVASIANYYKYLIAMRSVEQSCS